VRAPTAIPTPWARTPRQPTTRWSVHRGAALVEPPPLAISPYSMCSHPPHRPPNGDAAVRALHRPWMAIAVAPPPCPCHGPLFGDARDPLVKARLSIKGGRFSPRASTEPPSSAIGAPAVNPVLRPIPRHPKLRTSSLGLPRAATGTSCPAFPFPSPEFELPWPSPGSPNPARASAYSPSQWVLVAPPLARTEALYTTHCSAEPFPLPDFAPSRPCCPCAAAAARRRPLRPSYHRQSLCGELNRRPV
jgi:hypothetical protein